MTSEEKPNTAAQVAEGIATFAGGVSKATSGVVGVAGGLVSGVGGAITAVSKGGKKVDPEKQAKIDEANKAAYDRLAVEQAMREGRDEVTAPKTDENRGAWIAS